MSLLLLLAAAHAATLPTAQVTLPWSDFQTLYERGQAPKDPPIVAPRDYTLNSAAYSGKVVGDGDDAYASLHATIRGEVLKEKGWSAVPLLSASTALRSARVNGKEAAVYLENGYYTLVTDTPGAFTVELDFAAGLTTSDAETFFSFDLAPSGATTVAFSLDTADALDFDVANARGVTERTAGQTHTVEAVLPSTGSLAVSWQRKVVEEKAQEARVYAETQTLVGVSDGVLAAHATVNYTVLHKGVQTLRVKVPTNVTVLDVQGAGIRDWKEDATGTLTVALNYEALGGYALGIDYERPLGNGNLPLVSVLDVARESDWIGVDARSALELVAGTATGATPVDVRELPASLVGQTDFPVLLAWKARGGDVQIPLEVKSHPDVDMLVTLIDTAMADTLVTVDGRRMTHMRYAVRNNRNQFLRVSLPTGAEVWSASVAGRGVKVAKGDNGILIPLVRSDASGGALSAFLVDLVYVENGEALGTSGTARAELPRADAPTSELQWTVYFPADAKLQRKSWDGTVRHVDYFSAQPQLPTDATVSSRDMEDVQNAVQGQQMAGTLGQGVEPVEVNLPLSGQQTYFEKMLVLDEPLWVSFDYTRKVR